MTKPEIVDVQRGWKVFDSEAKEIGAVTEVGGSSIRVTAGRIIRHEYVVPAEVVAHAEEGVVDLRVPKVEIEAGLPGGGVLPDELREDVPPKGPLNFRP